jgi:hypothetical protein
MEQKTMNMISTGAFLTEMDASRKQDTLASKLVSAWEKKNSKTARAGGVSLMALSLAACGSSDDTSDIVSYTQAQLDAAKVAATAAAEQAAEVEAASAAATLAASKQAAADAAVVAAEAAAVAQAAAVAAATEAASPSATSSDLTTTAGDVITGTTGDDTINGVVSVTASKNTYDTADSVVDGTSTDADVFNLTTDSDVTTLPSITGIETMNVTLNALSSGSSNVTNFDLSITNVAATTVVNVDSINDSSIVSGLVITGDKGGTLNSSADFTTITTAISADGTAVYNVSAPGSAASAVAFTATGAADNLTIDAAGYLTVTAAAVTDLVNVKAVNNVTITSATASAALIVDAGGDATITDADNATVAKITAGGKITGAADALDAALAPTFTAGTTISVDLKVATVATVSGAKTITITDNTTTLATVNATVNTEATTVDLKGSAGVTTVNMFGDQNYTLVMDAQDIDAAGDKVTLTDATTAGTSTFKIGTTAGDVIASGMTVDVINLAIDQAGEDLTVASGQKVTISADQNNDGSTANAIIKGLAASAASNTVAITLDDGTRSATSTAVDLLEVEYSNLSSVTIDASADSLLSGGAETHAINTLIGNTADVSITAGANNLTLGGPITLGATNTLTITGSGKVTGDGSNILTAKTADLSEVSGVVTLSTLQADEVGTVKTGAGADVLTYTTGAADRDVSTGAGDDTLTLELNSGGNTLTVDMGTGNDTLILTEDGQYVLTGTDTMSISGVENVTYTGAAGTDYDIASAFFNGQAFSLKDTATADGSFTVTAAASDTAIDLSLMTVTNANAAKVKAETFIVDVSGGTLDGIGSIKGALVAKNTITANDLDATTIVGGGFVDVLTGGALNDTISGGAGADTINGKAGVNALTGGAGIDTIITGTGTDTISDFTAGSGAAADIVHLSLAGLEAQSTMDFIQLDDSTSQTASLNIVATKIQGVFDLDSASLVSDTNTLIMHGATIANTSALETAIETSGDYELTAGAVFAAGDGFLVTYSDGTNSYLATVETVGGIADGAKFGAGDLVATNMLTFTGISDVDTIVVGQFADIVA